MEEIGRLRKSAAAADQATVLQASENEKQRAQEELKKLQNENRQLMEQSNRDKHALEVQIQKTGEEIARQLPELASAAASHAENKCRERYEKALAAVQDKYREQFEKEALKVNQIETNCRQVEQESRYNVKSATSEAAFLRKELMRVEDNNKMLLDQLQALRSHMTHGAAMKYAGGPAMLWSPPDRSLQHLQQQLSNMQKSFHTLLSHNREGRTSTTPMGTSNPTEEDSPQMVAKVDEIIASVTQRQPSCNPRESLNKTESIDLGSTAVVAPIDVNDLSSSWYRDGYWKTKYLSSKLSS